MAIAKCRLDIWNPTIGGSATNKWVTAQTPENRNAVVSVYLFDKLANPRTAEIIMSNRAKDFSAPTSGDDPPSTFEYIYKDPIGGTVGTVSDQPLRRGVLTDFFSDFQFVRLVDQASNQVFFAGRILDIKEGYDARKGQLITLKAVDALYELAKHSLRGMSKSISFYKGSSGHTVTDMTKAFIAMYFQKEYLDLLNVKDITKDSTPSDTDDVAVDTEYHPPATVNRYRTNIVTDDTGTALRNRFVTTTQKISSDRKVDLTKIKKTGFLGEILKTLQHSPQSNQSTNESFGWDYFVDPNISYGEHADFRGKNFDPETPPPPQMFNAFERGKRVYNIEPATYGLAVKYPAASSVTTQGHRTTVPASGSPVPRYATKPMSVDFDFTRPKDNLYSSVLLKYNDAESDTKGTDQKESAGKGKEKEIVCEIVYVTEISAAFKYQLASGSGDTLEVDSWGMDDAETVDSITRPGVFSAEWCSLYQANGTTLVKAMACRIQYQSNTTLTGSDNYGYVILSHMKPDFLNVAAGNYVLKGRGDGSGTNASNSTCKINLGATIASKGYPRRVWGLDKQKTLTEGVLVDGTAMRQKVASTLSRSSVEIVDGKFSVSGPPMYHWDGEVRTITSVTGGQQISLQDVGVEANGNTPGTAVELWRYGFREGMVIAKMNDGYTSLAQVNGRDVFGYCFGIPLDLSYKVNLTESVNFAAGDKVRFFIPLRAGDTIRVENVLTDVAGNHLITELTYTEEPNQMTRFTTTGVNEGFGLGVSGFQASLSEMREESDLTMNLPKGHQIAIWNGLFSAVDNNTVQWQTVGGKAQVILADGTTYDIDTATSNNTNTTDASSTDSGSNRFGLATPPAAGDDTIYYIYVDPNTENVQKDTDGTHFKHHFYTRPSTSPETGSDPVYAQDGDNIIIAWMKAGATADDLAEFGVYRDSKPGEGKRNLSVISHPGSATSALLKKGAQTFTSDLQVQASTWDDDLARREVKWHGGEATADTTNANIKLADGDDRTIAYGGDSGDTGGGSYSYTTNGTSYSTITAFSDNSTYYGFIDFKEDASGNMLLRWTNSHTIPYGDDRILLVMIVVPPDNTKGRSPIIIPFGTKSLSINAVAIAANSITADHVAAQTISTAHIVAAGIAGSKLNIDSGTTFSSGYDPTEKAKTTADPTAPSSPNSGDLWIDTNDLNKLYRWNGSSWALWDLGLARATADTAVTNAATAQGTANTAATNATAANNELDDIADDAKVTPDEKNVAKRLYTSITDEYSELLADGATFLTTSSVYYSNYATKYAALVTYITSTISVFNSMTATTSITRATWDTKWSEYYEHRQYLLNAIARKAKVLADDAATVAASKNTTFRAATAPNALKVGDVWIDTDDQKIYTASATGTGDWELRDDAGAINAADTDINGGRIQTQAIVLVSGGGKILEDGSANSGAGASRVVLSNTGIFGYNASSVFQFKMQATDGKASFNGGATLLDADGINIYTSSGGTLKSRFNKDGISLITGITTALDFRSSVPSGAIKAFMNTTGDGSTTYGSNSNQKMSLWSNTLDITLEATGQDIGLFPDSNTGYVKLGDRPLVFMDSTSTTSGLHSSSMDFVGWWKRTGSISASTVYRLPFTGASDGYVLAIDGSASGSGSPTNPYTYNLEWVAQSGGGGSSDGVVNSASWNTSTGVLTLGRSESLSSITVDLDGRYVTSDTNTWRGIDDTPVNGQTGESITSNWAYDHLNDANAHHTPTSDTNTWRGIDNTPVNGQTGESITSNWAYDHLNNANAHHTPGSGGGSGTVNSGSSGYLAYYPSTGTTVDDQNQLQIVGGVIKFHGSDDHNNQRVTQLWAGTNSLASVSFYSYANTGMYMYSAGNVALTSSGTTRLICLGSTTHIYNNLNVHGSLTKSSGSFSIPHPLDEENKHLVHGFVESPRFDLIYRGIVTLSNGTATASIDEASNNMTVGTFTALTRNPQVWVQNDTGWGAVKGVVENGNILITAEDATSSDTISWLVVAERNDTYVNSSREPWTDENGVFVPEWNNSDLSLWEDEAPTPPESRPEGAEGLEWEGE